MTISKTLYRTCINVYKIQIVYCNSLYNKMYVQSVHVQFKNEQHTTLNIFYKSMLCLRLFISIYIYTYMLYNNIKIGDCNKNPMVLVLYYV